LECDDRGGGYEFSIKLVYCPMSYRLVHRNIGTDPPCFPDGLPVATINDKPGPVRRSPYGKIRFAIAVVIPGTGMSPASPHPRVTSWPSFRDHFPIAAVRDQPAANRGAEHGNIRIAISIVITDDRIIVAHAPGLHLFVARAVHSQPVRTSN